MCKYMYVYCMYYLCILCMKVYIVCMCMYVYVCIRINDTAQDFAPKAHRNCSKLYTDDGNAELPSDWISFTSLSIASS